MAQAIKAKMKLVLSLAACSAIIIGFQNCAPVEFAGTNLQSKLAEGGGREQAMDDIPDIEDPDRDPAADDQPTSPSVPPVADDDSKDRDCKDRKQAEDREVKSSPSSCKMIARSSIKLEGNVAVVSCGKSGKSKCAVICHIPEGNPEAKKTLVVGSAAAKAGHAPGSHGGDHAGACDSSSEMVEVCEAK